jgi:peptidoglycan/xylan/chitin deacetylase (PgdA/CDA1 family)
MMKSLLLKAIDRLNFYALFGRATSNRAAVFMLHEILPSGAGNEQQFSSDRLESFLAYLRDNRFNVISLRKYVDLLSNKTAFEKTVVFTVDDGFADFYDHAFPVFRRLGYSATIFLTSDFIDGKLFFWWNQIEYAFDTTRMKNIDLACVNGTRVSLCTANERAEATSIVIEAVKKLPNETKLRLIADLLKTLEVDVSGQPSGKYRPLTWEQIHEMHQNGIDFYPHTKTHPILTRISREEKILELAESKRRLEQELGQPMDIFCYPNGGPNDVDDETVEVLKECRYRAAVTGIPGFDDSTSELNPFFLRRYAIPNSLPVFKQIVCGLEAVKERIRK